MCLTHKLYLQSDEDGKLKHVAIDRLRIVGYNGAFPHRSPSNYKVKPHGALKFEYFLSLHSVPIHMAATPLSGEFFFFLGGGQYLPI
jgi:hypothetical protein